jgi:ubiquinone/menaquinone biosynthesis C-methylase UbiE
MTLGETIISLIALGLIKKKSRMQEDTFYLRIRDSHGFGVLDPADFMGFKNTFIDSVQKAAMDEIVCSKDNNLILEFGCGIGRFCSWASDKATKVIGLDIDANLLNIAKKVNNHPNIEYILYNGTSVPFKDKIFDIILCIGLLNKNILPGNLIKNAISEFYRLLKDKGRVLAIDKIYRRQNNTNYTRQELINFFNDEKFLCKKNYPIRKGRSLLGYLIQYRLLPQKFIPQLAKYELNRRKKQKEPLFDYQNFLFEFEKK